MRSTDGTAADGAAMAKLIAVAPPPVALQGYAHGRENVTEGCPGSRQTNPPCRFKLICQNRGTHYGLF